MIPILDAVGRFSSTAIVGAGGKSSTMFRMARAYAPPVFVSNSAHLSIEQTLLAERFYIVEQAKDLPNFDVGIPSGITLFCGPELTGRGRVRGLDEDLMKQLCDRAEAFSIPVLIEADGSRGLALKAPAEHEPPIPAFVQAVVVCAGMSGLAQNLDGEYVYRAENFARISGVEPEQPVDEAALARVLTSPEGGIKNIPPAARRIALLNQADTAELQERGAQLARLLLPAFSSVVIASLHGPGPEGESQVHAVFRPTAGIVLAAGASRRFNSSEPNGRLKQLLEWQGEPLVRRTARIALEAGLDPVVVVTGAGAADVAAGVSDLRVVITHCDDWVAGQSASLKTGLRRALALRSDLDGAVFLLCDQPYATAAVVRAVADQRARTLSPACAPRADGRRSNPVLFGRELFPRLLALEGDAGGRQVLANIQVDLIDWPDARLNEDIDTVEDYDRLRLNT